MVRIVSFYNDAINPEIVELQKKVFDHFAIDVLQLKSNLDHYESIDLYLSISEVEHIAIFDIDCIPLNRNVITEGIEIIKAGALYGAAQQANHIKRTGVYVSPAFMMFSKEFYDDIERPSFMPTERGDTGAELTWRAKEKEKKINLVWPVHVEIPKWDLGISSTFGLGTNYNNTVYHGFESRMNSEGSKIFIDKCKKILNK